MIPRNVSVRLIANSCVVFFLLIFTAKEFVKLRIYTCCTFDLSSSKPENFKWFIMALLYVKTDVDFLLYNHRWIDETKDVLVSQKRTNVVKTGKRLRGIKNKMTITFKNIFGRGSWYVAITDACAVVSLCCGRSISYPEPARPTAGLGFADSGYEIGDREKVVRFRVQTKI